MSKKILLLGCAGFIGSNLVRHLLYNYRDYSIIGIDKLVDPSSMHNVYANKSHEFYIGDICDEHFLSRIFEIHGPNYVINLAGQNLLLDNSKYSAEIKGVYNILSCSYKYGVKKIIDFTPSFVYDNDGTEMNENSSIRNINLYLSSYLAVENMIHAFCIDKGMDYNVLRCSEVFGQRQNILGSPILQMYDGCKNNCRIQLSNKGEYVPNYLYVEDLCSAIITVMEKGNKNTIYNASANIDFTELEIAQMIIDHVKAGDIEFPDMKNIYLNGNFLKLNIERISQLGWKPARKFKEALKYTLSWYDKNLWALK